MWRVSIIRVHCKMYNEKDRLCGFVLSTLHFVQLNRQMMG